jgi:sulfide:quinone oxidoreductase
MAQVEQHQVLIVGGGSGGLSVAARLRNLPNPPEVSIIEPSEHHYYQPLWTLVGAGLFDKEITRRPQGDYMPDGAKWLKTRVTGFDPEQNIVLTADGGRHAYQYLVVALGIQLDWHKIDGLVGNIGKNGICSNYAYETVDSTRSALQSFKSGNAVFTFPATPVKCAGAPQKIMYLADDVLRRAGKRDNARILYAASGPAIFGVQKYARSLAKVVQRKNIDTMFRHNLIAVDAAKKQAVFKHLDRGDEVVVPFELLHVTPPQSAPDVVKQSRLANAEGWVDVHKYTLQHLRYPNVFGLGDSSSLPTSRTGAAIRKQAPVLVDNLQALREGRVMTASYDGYASCPLVTGIGKLILAEFDYDGKPAESFPFDQSQERFSMYMLKAYALPELYWNGMLRGRA